MKSQQAAEREEQQRIKNLVLNYDLHEDDLHDGTSNAPLCRPVMQMPLKRNPNTKGFETGPDHYNPSLSRAEKGGRHAPRARRLNLSDVDWYGSENSPSNDANGGKDNKSLPHASKNKSPRVFKKPG